jgi:hypothetical protein
MAVSRCSQGPKRAQTFHETSRSVVSMRGPYGSAMSYATHRTYPGMPPYGQPSAS